MGFKNLSAAEIKTKYESNADTNAFTDADETKLDGLSAGAEVNPDLIPQAEAEAGVATTERVISAERMAQAIAALAPAAAGDLTVVPQAVSVALSDADKGKAYLLTAASVVVTLPDPAVVGSGWSVIVKEFGNFNSSSVARFAAEDIDGTAANYNLQKYEGVRIVTDGTDWALI